MSINSALRGATCISSGTLCDISLHQSCSIAHRDIFAEVLITVDFSLREFIQSKYGRVLLFASRSAFRLCWKPNEYPYTIATNNNTVGCYCFSSILQYRLSAPCVVGDDHDFYYWSKRYAVEMIQVAVISIGEIDVYGLFCNKTLHMCSDVEHNNAFDVIICEKNRCLSFSRLNTYNSIYFLSRTSI